jgi:hypothetical protein
VRGVALDPEGHVDPYLHDDLPNTLNTLGDKTRHVDVMREEDDEAAGAT